MYHLQSLGLLRKESGIEFGVVTHTIGHGLSLHQTLESIRRIGFRSILLLTSREKENVVRADGSCPSAFPNLIESEPESVRKVVDNSGLRIGAVHFSGENSARQFSEHLKEYARATLAVGCRYLTHPVPSWGRSGTPTEEKAPLIRRLAECMNEVAEVFESDGLKLSVDVHYAGVVESLEDCRFLLDCIPCENAGVLLNIGHLKSAQAYGWLLLKEYPQRVAVVGWKDHSLHPRRPKPVWSIELGKRDSPFELYIRALKRNPAQRAHFINCENVPDEDRVDTLRRSLSYITELWESTE